jgi:hypothetical protein
MTPNEAVRNYIRDYRAGARAEMNEFRQLSSLREAIRHASLCHRLPSQRRHPHQYRIPNIVLQAAERELQQARHLLARAASFEALHFEIERRIRTLDGIGALTVYDIAHRIGAKLRKKPKLVYLHRGTRIGARRLGFTGKALDPRSLPFAFSRLAPDEIEDCLCIYKDDFSSGRSRARLLQPRRTCIRLPACPTRSC